MGLLFELGGQTISEWWRVVSHMTSCEECGKAWKGLTGKPFPASVVKVSTVTSAAN